jgi:hypothetical protein
VSNRRDGRRLGPVDGDRPERDPEISRGATATVKNNSVSGNVYQPATVVSVGVLLFTSGAVAVENNDLDQNDVGGYATPTPAQRSRTTTSRTRPTTGSRSRTPTRSPSAATR